MGGWVGRTMSAIFKVMLASRRMLEGFKSRWTMPVACRKACFGGWVGGWVGGGR